MNLLHHKAIAHIQRITDKMKNRKLSEEKLESAFICSDAVKPFGATSTCVHTHAQCTHNVLGHHHHHPYQWTASSHSISCAIVGRLSVCVYCFQFLLRYTLIFSSLHLFISSALPHWCRLFVCRSSFWSCLCIRAEHWFGLIFSVRCSEHQKTKVWKIKSDLSSWN